MYIFLKTQATLNAYLYTGIKQDNKAPLPPKYKDLIPNPAYKPVIPLD